MNLKVVDEQNRTHWFIDWYIILIVLRFDWKVAFKPKWWIVVVTESKSFTESCTRTCPPLSPFVCLLLVWKKPRGSWTSSAALSHCRRTVTSRHNFFLNTQTLDNAWKAWKSQQREKRGMITEEKRREAGFFFYDFILFSKLCFLDQTSTALAKKVSSFLGAGRVFQM